uniref:OmpH family outer membrane protein n=1 Tax=Roseihalotalea indica TaxID=2867963 RepID=A0AA49JEY8_9BACT|nr:OmpH family outer membrane protein [Tunicatimonas sp. TK19036]
MKRNVLILISAFTLFVGAQAQAQQQKFGFVSTEYVLGQMPEAKSIQSELQAYSRQLQNKIQATVQGFQTQVDAYQKGAATMTEEARTSKEQELQELQQQIQQDQQEAQVNLQRKEAELLQPALDKIQKAIDAVAKENSYTHIFSLDVAGNPILLYVQNEDEADISDLVLKNMGITPTEASGSGSNE